jgi:DNA-binding response OmpR family regulator
MIIEDDEDLLEIVRLALKGKYVLQLQTDTRDIAQVTRGFDPDLILIDNYIGEKQAGEIIKQIKNTELSKKILFVLFSGAHNIRQIAAEIGADGWLAKPFLLSELLSRIEHTFTLNT